MHLGDDANNDPNGLFAANIEVNTMDDMSYETLD